MGKIKFELRQPVPDGFSDLLDVSKQDQELEQSRVDFLIRKCEV